MAVKTISIIVPMLNEAEQVEQFDGSVPRLKAAAELHAIPLIIISNADHWVSHALNACVQRARGDLIVRLDCHSKYPRDYLRRCAIAAAETGADVVGGIIVAEGRTGVERVVACAMDSPFGGIGFYRILSNEGSMLDYVAGMFGLRPSDGSGAQSRVETDTVTFGAFRPDVFRRVGLFDESLRRNQDDEFNLRVRRSGGRVVLDPSIHVYYTPRASFRRLFRQYFEYGLWKVPVMIKHRQLPGPRSLTPAAFLVSLVALASVADRSPAARRALVAEVALYALCAAGFAFATVRRRGEPLRVVPPVACVFPTFHVGYGSGMLCAGAKALAAAVTGTTARPPQARKP
jgi:glycosyltransferase involved in cell wall biosynthesis